MILRYLKSVTSHPTAEQIYDTLRQENKELSLSTVYRNLSLLAEDGVIRRLDTGGSEDRFDADTSVHSHFVCRKCGQVSDIFKLLFRHDDLEQALDKSFSVEQYTLYVYGLCDRCNHE